MKTLVAVIALLALVVPAYATEAADIRKWEDLNSGCHNGVFPDDEDVDVHSTQKEYDRTARGKVCLAARKLEKKLTPYQEGMRDYREGQCYRARPYSDNTPEGQLWEKGWKAHQTKKQGRRNDEHCFPERDIKEKHG